MNYIYPYLLKNNPWQPAGTLKTFYRRGNPVAVLVKRTDKADFYGISEVNMLNLGPGTALLERALENDHNNVWLHVNLAMIYQKKSNIFKLNNNNMNTKKKQIVDRVGCFALIEPFATLDKQLEIIKSWGFSYADVTDNADGACLGTGYGFTSLASLDANPFDLKRMFDNAGLKISSVCAHAELLDPTAPWRYGTSQIIKAVKIAGSLGIKHVITSEGDPKTEFGKNLSEDQAIFTITEKLYEPLRLASDYGVKILIEPHGHISDSVKATEKVLNACNSDALGLNLDTGNLWLGGGDPVEYVRKFGSLIEHVHWKDLPAEMESERGKIFGCGMAVIPLGTGVVPVEKVFNELVKIGFNGYSTLEIAGEDAVKKSHEFLKGLAKD